ncbi:DNA repair metallo-beta-lactamase family protein [Striga hermonthica]|uniref:DNA repair metallo-beta-lactamase family protein n=1 Tax=Striga hermonthica TaxID=68872 RepID=A0A9N7NWA9_STRHE|nr:DNA repair metallo-beta-lactamase family protein [Striga hermonthica]
MPIEMPRGLPFSVDTWSPSSKRKSHHFLTHAHKDHAQGIVAHASYPIYSSLLTKTLILQYYPQLDESMFVGIEVRQSMILDDPYGDFVVTAFDANHCPGALMFLFEGNFGNILHTGDCRLVPECLLSLPDKFIGKEGKQPRCPLDYIFLDCTFGQCALTLPSRHTAIQQIINCIWKHPQASTVYLACDLLGQEDILLQVSQTFGEKIYVDKTKNPECFKSLELIVPEVMSHDPASRFQLFDGFPKLYERAEARIAEARANFQHEPLIIRPSSQWYASDAGTSELEKRRKERQDQAVRDLCGVWHVCYSIHSSREELEWALQLLAPKWVVSTTPNCRAMELNYVKKHCFNNQLSFNRSLQKLMDISAVTSIGSDESVENLGGSQEDNISINCVEVQPEPVITSTHRKKRLSLSPPSKRPSLTLFGRARAGLHDSAFQNEQKVLAVSDYPETTSTGNEDVCNQNDVADVEFGDLLKLKRKGDVAEINCISTDLNPGGLKNDVVLPTGSSSTYNENFRRVYRSMNVPVPQRLPSLTDFMDARSYPKKMRE